MSPSAASARDEGRIVLFLAGVEAGILQQQNVAGLQAADRRLCRLADAVLGEGDGPADRLGDFVRQRRQRLLRIAALRPAEMRQQDDLAALVGDLGDGRRHALDARGVGDLAVLHRHVEIDAQQHALAGEVGVIERAERAHDCLAPGSLFVAALACVIKRRIGHLCAQIA